MTFQRGPIAQVVVRARCRRCSPGRRACPMWSTACWIWAASVTSSGTGVMRASEWATGFARTDVHASCASLQGFRNQRPSDAAIASGDQNMLSVIVVMPVQIRGTSAIHRPTCCSGVRLRRERRPAPCRDFQCLSSAVGQFAIGECALVLAAGQHRRARRAGLGEPHGARDRRRQHRHVVAVGDVEQNVTAVGGARVVQRRQRTAAASGRRW